MGGKDLEALLDIVRGSEPCDGDELHGLDHIGSSGGGVGERTVRRARARGYCCAFAVALIATLATAASARAAPTVSFVTSISLGVGFANLPGTPGAFVFSADDGSHGYELWRSNGVGARTRMVRDINRGDLPSGPSGFTRYAGKVFFTATGPYHGDGLWSTDGTRAGTKLVKDTNPNAASSFPRGITSFAAKPGTVAFDASDGAHGFELWRSDGTSTGTKLVKDINPRPQADGLPTIVFANLGQRVFFPGDDGTHGTELWSSDGTSAGTKLVKDIYRGANSAIDPLGFKFYGFTRFRGALIFPATDPTRGFELRRSTGTAAGTSLFADVNPGFDDSYSYVLGHTANALYFAADGGTRGGLWKAVP
jgi:ELWxxDGT repeat protein